MGLKSNDVVILPEYICDVVLHPLKQLGIKYKFYTLDDALTPKWETMDILVDGHTKAVMMVHYFGQPQEILAFQKFCEIHSLFLIEDNAHGHGGMFNNQPLGSFGDIGISSPRKTNSKTISGGVLWFRHNELEPKFYLQTYPVSLGQYIITSLINPFPKLKYSIKKLLENRPKFENPRAFQESIMPDYSIDTWSKKIIERTKWNEMCNARQAAYLDWQDIALENGLRPVFKELHSESNPWCFPAYVKNHQEAIKWFDWGWKHNEHVFSWPSLPVEVLERQGESFDRWKRIICFEIL